ncbi:hypothetical protein QLS71_015790 [Mariniflexile litorale]|uniref:STAS/SEC14 domain-containing protein n=1 Tax=Mariniflexile litorale TaxID=3045158 RepID=A0AAU7EF64_9FLAO|nr:hypothetical protein [Mariniflexile sp. KMM 9835]MDQ8212393.1 hypothetical protein [Mariniflexile sp. KMM 9835]
MTFEESNYSKLSHYKLVKPFGTFYFLETFIISELNDGVHFDWEMIKDAMSELINFYGNDIKLVYISNRVNSYSMNPQTWITVAQDYDIIVANAIVTYNKMAYMNAKLEKKYTNMNINHFLTLDEAINWALKFTL